MVKSKGSFGYNPIKITRRGKWKKGKVIKVEYKERKSEPFSWRNDLPKNQKTWKPKKRKTNG